MPAVGRIGRTSLLKNRVYVRHTARRHASSEHGAHSQHHAAPVNESFGRGFYISLASIPIALALYKLSQPADGSEPYFTRLIDGWSDYQELWEQRNSLHSKMVEQAAFDRNLFQSSRKNATVELRFPEIFNTGSPYNHIAGHSGGDLTTLIEHYEKQNRDEEERKVRAQQEEGERE